MSVYNVGDLVKIKSKFITEPGIIVDVLQANVREPLWSKYLVFADGKTHEISQRQVQNICK